MPTSLLKISHADPNSKARAGEFITPHGVIETPVFMPVGTQATVKTVDSKDLEKMGYKIVLANTYHLFLRPGFDTLKEAGGLHQFMSWPGSILTDSGGYQIFSLATRRKLSEEGVIFSSHIDGSPQKLTPESATQFQLDIGVDIAMCLDECPPYPSLESDAEISLQQTLRWAKRCKTVYRTWLNEQAARPLLFGITQGAQFSKLRRRSSQETVSVEFPGYAVGGLGVGEPKSLTWELLKASLEPLPYEAPRYLMGFGQPEDIWLAVEQGVDMFDCVLPTRNARNGQAFTSTGKFQITNTPFRRDFNSLDAACSCPTCERYSRSYLCHLFRAGELLGPRLLTLHNLWFMISLVKQIRTAIRRGSFTDEKKAFFNTYQYQEKEKQFV